MKITRVVLSLACFLLPIWFVSDCLPLTVEALDATSSAITPNQKILEKVKERMSIEGEQPENNQMQSTSNLLFGYFGILKEVQDNSLRLEDAGQIKINHDTSTQVSKLQSGIKTKLSVSDLKNEVGSFLIAIGKKSPENTLAAARISFSAEPKSTDNKRVVFGLVTEVENNRLTLNAQNSTDNLSVNSQTVIMTDGSEKISIDDIIIDDKIVCIYNLTNSDKVAKRILVIPGKKNPVAVENKINSTVSAGTVSLPPTPSPTPSSENPFP